MAFNIDKFAETSARVKWSDLDMDEFLTNPLPEDSLRCLRYMCDVEYHTTCFVRELLVTPSHREDAPAAFMTMWNREEFWHGEALAAVLQKHGIHVDYDEIKAKRVKLGWAEALKPLKQSLLSALIGHDFVATHMTWGAANEYSAVAAYKRMAAIESHPVLSELLVRIAALPNVVGAKVSELSLGDIAAYRAVVPADFELYTGADRDHPVPGRPAAGVRPDRGGRARLAGDRQDRGPVRGGRRLHPRRPADRAGRLRRPAGPHP